MNNFIGTEFENMSEEEIFLCNEKLVKATLRKKFPNHRAFCQAHMLELEDLVQMGSIGLVNAIRTYDSNLGTSFRSHAINRIAWAMQVDSRKDSLRKVNTRTSELADIVSVEIQVEGQDENISLLDTLQSNNNTSLEAESNLLIEKIVEILLKDKEVDEDMLYIIIARAKGDSMQSIANHLGCHRNSIVQRLKTKKAERIKMRLKSYLENGEC